MATDNKVLGEEPAGILIDNRLDNVKDWEKLGKGSSGGVSNEGKSGRCEDE